MKHYLIKEHRKSTRSDYSFFVSFGDAGDDLIRITEFHDYWPVSGDSGREYGYTLKIERTHLPHLARVLANWGGLSDPPEDSETAVVACLQRMVTVGPLIGDALRLRYDTIKGWLDHAEIPYEESFWFWLDSD